MTVRSEIMLIIFPKTLVVRKQFFCITLSTLLMTLLLLIGCDLETADDLPETATVKLDIPASMVVSEDEAINLIVSTDFDFSDFSEIVYNTKQEFRVTQDFEQTFQLASDEPGIAVEFMNTLSESVHLIILLDDQVEHEETISPGTRSIVKIQTHKVWSE